MPFLLLLVLALACAMPDGPKPALELSLQEYAALAWSAIGVVIIGASLFAHWSRRTLRLDPSWREAVISRYGSFRLYHLLALIVTYGLALYVLGWGYVVREMTLEYPAVGFVRELLLLAPFLCGLVLSWSCFYDAERAIHNASVPLFQRPYWTRGAYVTFHARQNLALVVAPVVLLVISLGLRRLFPEAKEDERYEIASFGLLALVFACLPWVLRLVLGLRPLPAGALRDRLAAAARRLNFRCSDILLWNTYSGVANAMVVGVLPMPRYVVLSDRLIAGLTYDEVEAVFGHEVGHVKHYHMIYYLSFLFMSLVALYMMGEMLAQAAIAQWPGLEPWLNEANTWVVLPFLSSLVLYIFVVFGFLSRRCERQADIYGCRAVSCGRCDCPHHADEVKLLPDGRGLCPTGIRTFIQALEKVAQLNGMSRSKPGWLQSWQHSTIARRVEFLQHMLADPHLEPRFQRRVGQVKWALIVGLGALLVLLTVSQG
ncbi:MAG: M48 family metalloprotease [Gemmataceae bacterium]|nr:M48 family metalloprotease [Gemmataceae bacterium]